MVHIGVIKYLPIFEVTQTKGLNHTYIIFG